MSQLSFCGSECASSAGTQERDAPAVAKVEHGNDASLGYQSWKLCSCSRVPYRAGPAVADRAHAQYGRVSCFSLFQKISLRLEPTGIACVGLDRPAAKPDS